MINELIMIYSLSKGVSNSRKKTYRAEVLSILPLQQTRIQNSIKHLLKRLFNSHGISASSQFFRSTTGKESLLGFMYQPHNKFHGDIWSELSCSVINMVWKRLPPIVISSLLLEQQNSFLKIKIMVCPL